MRRFAAVAALILAASLAAGARADIWKWVDNAGHLHYSDHPAPGAVLVKRADLASDDASAAAAASAATTAAASAASSTSPAEDDAPNADADLAKQAAENAVHKDEAALRAKDCKQAKADYAKLIAARRIYRTEPNGEREYLSDADADAMRVKVRLAMESACGSSSE